MGRLKKDFRGSVQEERRHRSDERVRDDGYRWLTEKLHKFPCRLLVGAILRNNDTPSSLGGKGHLLAVLRHWYILVYGLYSLPFLENGMKNNRFVAIVLVPGFLFLLVFVVFQGINRIVRNMVFIHFDGRIQIISARNSVITIFAFNQMFIDLCQSDSPDVEGALKDASAQITEGCQISYSMK